MWRPLVCAGLAVGCRAPHAEPRPPIVVAAPRAPVIAAAPAPVAPRPASNAELVAALATDAHESAVAALADRASALDAADRAAAAAALLELVARLEPAGPTPDPELPAVIRLLGRLHAVTAVSHLSSIVMSRGSDDLSAAAIEALGAIGDPRAVPALVHGYFHTYPDAASLALAQVGAIGAEPLILEVLAKGRGDDQIFGDRFNPNAAVALLGRLATSPAVAALHAVLADRHRMWLWEDAANALALAAAVVPGERKAALATLRAAFAANRPDPDRQRNLQPYRIGSACSGFGSLTTGEDDWMALAIAPSLVMLGDPADRARIAKLRALPVLARSGYLSARIDLLSAETLVVRHADSGALAADLAATRAEVAGVDVATACEADSRGGLLDRIDKLAAAVAVARDCTDGDVACYADRMASTAPDVAHEAALLMAWTAAPADRAAARVAILAKLAGPVPTAGALDRWMVNRTVSFYALALAILSTAGCPECGDAISAASASQLVWSDRAELAWLAFHVKPR